MRGSVGLPVPLPPSQRASIHAVRAIVLCLRNVTSSAGESNLRGVCNCCSATRWHMRYPGRASVAPMRSFIQVIVITNAVDAIDAAFFRRFSFVLEFEMPKPAMRQEARHAIPGSPSCGLKRTWFRHGVPTVPKAFVGAALRPTGSAVSHGVQLWKALLPKEAPCSACIDFPRLAQAYEFAGGSIKTTVFRAAVCPPPVPDTTARRHARTLPRAPPRSSRIESHWHGVAPHRAAWLSGMARHCIA